MEAGDGGIVKMSSQEESVAPAEIVIVRRRAGGEDEGHHGSAWKIAYADFVTAMMAFFLVKTPISPMMNKIAESPETHAGSIILLHLHHLNLF